MKCFNLFSKASGLQVNKAKSQVYCDGVSEVIEEQIQNITGMEKGIIPFKYLGVSVSFN